MLRTVEWFYQVAYNLWQSVGELFLPFGSLSWGMWIQIVMKSQLLCVHLFHLFHHIFYICQSLPLLISAHNFLFWSPVLGRQLQNLLSQDRYSLWKATSGGCFVHLIFLWRVLGILHVGFSFSRCPDLLLLLLQYLTRFDPWVSKDCILYLPAPSVSLGVLQLISNCSSFIIIIIMQGIDNYIPETNQVSRVCSVAGVLYLQFMVQVMLYPVLNVLYFDIGTFQSMAVFCSSLISCLVNQLLLLLLLLVKVKVKFFPFLISASHHQDILGSGDAAPHMHCYQCVWTIKSLQFLRHELSCKIWSSSGYDCEESCFLGYIRFSVSKLWMFRRTCCLYIQCGRRLRQNVLGKRRHISVRLHGVTFQKAESFESDLISKLFHSPHPPPTSLLRIVVRGCASNRLRTNLVCPMIATA